MSVFDADFAGQAAPGLLEQLGRTVEYVDPLADPLTLTAVVAPVRSEQRDLGDGDVILERMRDVSIMTDAASTFGGVARPRAEANGRPVYVVVDGEIWAVRSVSITGSMARLTCVQSQHVEAAREALRTPR